MIERERERERERGERERGSNRRENEEGLLLGDRMGREEAGERKRDGGGGEGKKC